MQNTNRAKLKFSHVLWIKTDPSGLIAIMNSGFVQTVRPIPWPNGLEMGLPVRTQPHALWQQASRTGFNSLNMAWYCIFMPLKAADIYFFMHQLIDLPRQWHILLQSIQLIFAHMTKQMSGGCLTGKIRLGKRVGLGYPSFITFILPKGPVPFQ